MPAAQEARTVGEPAGWKRTTGYPSKPGSLSTLTAFPIIRNNGTKVLSLGAHERIPSAHFAIEVCGNAIHGEES